MGCFIACLGGTRKQKRSISQPHHHQGLGSYQQLKSVSVKLDVKENNSTCHEPDSQLKKPTLRSVLGASKKVSFNLNVKTYELIDSQEEDEIPEKKENEKLGAAGENESTTSYPSNYRYKNFIDCENEEEEEDDVVDEDEDFDDCLEDCLSDHELDQSSIQGKGVFGLTKVHSVLSPVENTAQWRAVKVKTTTTAGGQSRHQCKENATSMQQEETRVDASLSSWIVGTI